MDSPPSSPTPLAGSSRFNAQQQHQSRQSLRFLLGGGSDGFDTDSDSDHGGYSFDLCTRPKKRTKLAGSNQDSPPTTSTKPKSVLVVKGNVTPSKAFSIFKRIPSSTTKGISTLPTPPPSSPLPLPSCSIESSVSSRSYSPHSPSSCFVSSPLLSYNVPSSSIPHSVGHGSVQDVLWKLRTRQSVSSSMPFPSIAQKLQIDYTRFLSSYVSPPSCLFRIPSTRTEGSAHPLCCGYSYSSRSVHPSAQWLAVGDDEGRVTLVNTLPAQDFSAEVYPTTPQWLATEQDAPASIFELAWRFDDRYILTGASDYLIRSWDVECGKLVDRFDGHAGSPRTIVYDPTTNGCGSIFASAGRDGTIHIWDARVGVGKSHGQDRLQVDLPSNDGDDDDHPSCESIQGMAPVLSIESAHTDPKPARRGRPPKSAVTLHDKKRLPQPKGVTALAFLPNGNGHHLISGGCENAVLKCWDIRSSLSQPVTTRSPSTSPVKRRGRPSKSLQPSLSSSSSVLFSSTSDLSLLACSQNKRSHGISHLETGSCSVFAACTDGNIYSIPSTDFLFPSSSSHDTDSNVLRYFHPTQRQNTLFSKIALYDDKFLAIGCNSGQVAVWCINNSSTSTSVIQDQHPILVEQQIRKATEFDTGIPFPSSSQKGNVTLFKSCSKEPAEINSLSWANGPNGPTLSTISDNTAIRSWFPDSLARQYIANPDT